MEYEDVQGEILSATDAAVLVDTLSGEQWIPKSLIIDGDALSEFSSEGSIEVQSWFVEQEGIY